MLELDEIINRYCYYKERELDDESYIPPDEALEGIQFAFAQIMDSLGGKQVVRDAALDHLFSDYREAYDAFYDKLS